MIQTKNLTVSLEDIPSGWIFEHYLNIMEPLTGQTVKLNSPFKTDKDPSFHVRYVRELNKYCFNDFSSGLKGSAVFLIMKLYSLNRCDAIAKVCNDYTSFINSGKRPSVDDSNYGNYRSPFKLTAYSKRKWTVDDKNFWTPYGITSLILNKYNVVALKNFTMSNDEESFTFNDVLMYGYFNKDGTIYKIYQPSRKKSKFKCIITQPQGVDMLSMAVPILVICSSLKDVMSFDALGFNNAEAVAPDSEQIDIPKHFMSLFKSKYSKMYSMFDNDETGVRRMKQMKEEHDIPYIHLEMEKDLSDSIAENGIDAVRSAILQKIKSIKNV